MKRITDLNGLILRAPLVGTFMAYLFLIFSSRPTADEYLLAPVLDGFYVDQPKVPLFNPSDDFIIRYFQGARAIVRLGWDAWLNALTFQMGSSAATNYLGPIATVIQATLFAIVVYIGLYVVAKFITSDRRNCVLVCGALVMGLMMAVPVANFNTIRANFGLYTFLGIRFGIYLVHAIVLIAVIVFLISSEEKTNRKEYFRVFTVTVLFCGFVSLWYVLYLFLFLLTRLFVRLILRRTIYVHIIMTLTLLSATFVLNNGLKGSRGRTAAAKTPLHQIAQNYLNDVILNHESRLYKFEPWNTVVGKHSVVAFLIGAIVVLIGSGVINWNLKNIKTLTRSLLLSIGLLPIVFLFQEYMTYEAWWHRTTPIAISIFAFFLLGQWVMILTEPKIPKLGTRAIAISMSIVLCMLVIGPLARGFKSVNHFRDSWDKGNILALGSPVENNADYNVTNAFRLHPYVNKKWDVQERMIGVVPYSVKWFDDKNLVIENRDQQLSQTFLIETGASVFDTELGGSMAYRLRITDRTGQGGLISLRDKRGVSVHKIKSGRGVVTELEGEFMQPGSIQLLDSKSPNHLLNLEILGIDFGFTDRLFESRGLKTKRYVVKEEKEVE